jgi:ADP-ribose pyrophosphatase
MGMTSVEPRERYEEIRHQWPELFVNLPDAGYTILFEPALVAAAEAEEKERLASRSLPSSWGCTGVVYEDPYTVVLRDAVRRPDGSLGTYARTMPASGAAGAAVLPLFEGRIVLLRHFRHATRAWHLEIPRGFGEPGVSDADQARQELREEIEAEVSKLVDLGIFHSNTGTATDRVRLFLAEIHAMGEPQVSEGISSIETLPSGQVAQEILSGAINDSFTIGAFTRAWLRGLLPGLPAPTFPHSNST